MAIAKAQPTTFDEDAVQHKLEKLAEQILALTPEELETLEIMLNPELMEELLRRSREAREHPEELLTHEEVFGRSLEDARREIQKSSTTGHSF